MTIRQEANARTRLHTGHPTQRILSKGHDYIALRGEELVADLLALERDRKLRPAGDKGIDFLTPIGSIDVKTSRGRGLLVEEGHARADIYILVYYYDAQDEVALQGWATRDEVLRVEPRDTGRGVINHYLPVARLRKMRELHALLEARRAA